jgi:hypothetical protein
MSDDSKSDTFYDRYGSGIPMGAVQHVCCTWIAFFYTSMIQYMHPQSTDVLSNKVQAVALY